MPDILPRARGIALLPRPEQPQIRGQHLLCMLEPYIPLLSGVLFADGGQPMGQGNRIRLVALPPSLLSPALAGADVHVEGLRQLCCRASRRQVQQLCGQGDHVPMGLASEAIVIGFVELHGRGLVRVKGATAHAVLSNDQPVTLSCLPYGNGSLDGFKQVHKHLLSENGSVQSGPSAFHVVMAGFRFFELRFVALQHLADQGPGLFPNTPHTGGAGFRLSKRCHYPFQH